MDLKDIFPIIVPTILIQVFIEAFYIKHCWENNTLTQKQKVIYIILIAIFNLPAAAFYFFYAGKKRHDKMENSCDLMEIDDVNKQGIFVLLLIAFEILAYSIIFKNMHESYYNLIIVLLAAGFVLLIIHALLLEPKQKLLRFTIPIVLILFILPVYYLDNGVNAQFLVLTVVASVINGYNLKYGKYYSLCVFILYMTCIVLKIVFTRSGFTSDDFLGGIYANALIYILVYAAFYAVKKQLLQNRLLQTAYRDLREQSLRLEEMAAISERNRIAGEIHDNVGHMLTTAMISIEAGEKLLEQDNKAALGKFALAREQVKRGLQSIRQSVQAVKKGGEEKPFTAKLDELLQEIRKNTVLMISDIVQIDTTLLPIQQKVLLQAIRESVTNSIKHGHSMQMDILLQEYKGTVQLTISDDGIGVEEIIFGSGLTFMEERVESLGGTMETESAKGEGFTVSITIPAGTQGGMG